MRTKTSSPSNVKAIEIECEAPEANAVMLVGDFNEWSMGATPMKKTLSGKWIASITVAPGRYEYKFFVDGCWCCEPGEPDECCGGPECVPNLHGTMNRVIEVK